jgi:hypothetical protein
MLSWVVEWVDLSHQPPICLCPSYSSLQAPLLHGSLFVPPWSMHATLLTHSTSHLPPAHPRMLFLVLYKHTFLSLTNHLTSYPDQVCNSSALCYMYVSVPSSSACNLTCKFFMSVLLVLCLFSSVLILVALSAHKVKAHVSSFFPLPVLLWVSTQGEWNELLVSTMMPQKTPLMAHETHADSPWPSMTVPCTPIMARQHLWQNGNSTGPRRQGQVTDDSLPGESPFRLSRCKSRNHYP